MAVIDVHPAYGKLKATVLHRKCSYGFSRASVRIFISKHASSCATNLVHVQSSSVLFHRSSSRPLAVSKAGPIDSLLDTGFQLLNNLKLSSESIIPSAEESAASNLDDFAANFMNSVNSFDLFVGALGFLAGLAAYVASFERLWPQLATVGGSRFAGDWVLFTTPTPFNRFVVLRCPSISFRDGLEDVNERLTKDNVHFVKLSSGAELSGYSCKGKIPNKVRESRFSDAVDEVGEGEFFYQRMCLSAQDGGVISLDWPASLDLAGEQGLDTAVLLIPGTAEGSNDDIVKGFVCKVLQHGYFPVVMNPRGCAGSPLTTPRLFTAADSDDICAAAQFITRLRPWTTLMGIGWGYGANMLAKYLGETSEMTPLTAAVCIGNPFDLNEATGSSFHHSVLDRKLTEGLKDILRSNKALFQGRRKGFNVASALSATSVREFEMAISRVAHGFDTIEEFYTKASSREIITSVKIPTLFIQNDHVVAPIFSVPRKSIEDNPFTSLLLCSLMSAGYTTANGQNPTIQWCDNLVIEWLEAVELALLKGRHPLLKDVDIAVKPANDPVIINSRGTQKHVMDSYIINSSKHTIAAGAEQSLGSRDMNAFDNSSGLYAKNEDGGHRFLLNNKSTSHKMVPRHKQFTDAEVQKAKPMDLSQETGSSIDTVNEVEDSESSEEEVERGQVLQTAETIMKVLDVTMPGTLEDEQKAQVLNAVGRGETLITALQSAVPEEVRGKITAAVTGAVQTGGLNIKLAGLRKGSPSSSLPMDMNIQEKIAEVSKGNVNGVATDNFFGSSSLEGKASQRETKQQEMVDSSSSGEGSGVRSEDVEELQIPHMDSNINEQAVGSSSLGKRAKEDMKQIPLKNELEQEKAGKDNEGTDKKYDQQNSENLTANEACADEQKKRKESITEADIKSVSEQPPKNDSAPDQKNDGTSINSQGDQGKQNSGAKIDDLSLQVGMDSDEQNKGEETSVESDVKSTGDKKYDEMSVGNQEEQNRQSSDIKAGALPPQDASSPIQSPSISMTQAFDALAGFDDSTQMAVTNVFGVIENMINQFEKEKQQRPEDIKPSANENQDSNPLPPQESSPDCGDENRSEKQEQVPAVATNINASSTNSGECYDIAQKSNVAESKEKLILNSNRMQQQDMDKVKHSTSKVEDGVHAQDVQNQNINAKEDEKYPGVISVSPNRIKYRDKFPLKDLGRLSFEGYPPVKNSTLTKSETGFENTETLNDLFLEYVPEEGQWKLLEKMESTSDSLEDESIHDTMKINEPKNHIRSGKGISMDVVEPSYVILNTPIDYDDPWEERILQNSPVQEIEEKTQKAEGMLNLVKNLVFDSLRIEVNRRLGMSRMKAVQLNLEKELSNVANAVALAVKQDLERSGKAMTNDSENIKHLKHCREVEVGKFGPLHGEVIVSAISSVLGETYILDRLLPLGVVVGASLVALRPIFIVVTGDEDFFETRNDVFQTAPGWEYRESNARESSNRKVDPTEIEKQHKPLPNERNQNIEVNNSENERENDGRVMMGAMTVALGATAALASHQMKTTGLLKIKDNKDMNPTTDSSLESKSQRQEPICDDRNCDEIEHEKGKPNIVSSLAEKAISVAAPVVPTKKDGEVDHERLVAFLADLGQKGGALRLVGKLALLWGGLRGAMSLTDRLLMFFRIAERPLHQRILGFACMALLLWSPVVVPLLPTLLQHWSLHTSLGATGIASTIGLYGAHFILVTIWGKRIRGYEKPLEQYGLSIFSNSEILNLIKGMIIGLTLVISLYSAHIFLGYAVFALKPEFMFFMSTGFISTIKTCFRVLRLVVHAFGMGLATATVEELLFRSWLHEEIASDLGFHKAVILSGIVFSSVHWSLPVMPGLWMLSVALSGARAKSNGNLSASIGLHAGLSAAMFFIESGGFVKFNLNAPSLLTGAYAGHPFAGAIGFGFIAILAVLLYPWNGNPEAQKLQTFNNKQVFPKEFLGNKG
ncbi:hypothetical protein SUGI_0134500 [Cryptomeria japonica]|uniref:uncharacterized protein LOC131063286 n=1 Tax=Cryptomeria japonica TaxID=3369 RepID=UPI0024089712|nr:uncharacterized protein LOC131063286 [Cryptomeria japonica]GLJ10762.1 hypothetical protein SUGI_0134500 [Cryptomeria japonica]